LVIVVNDNTRSYAPTIGGLADHLATLRTTRGYERFLDWGKNTLHRTPVVGGAMYETLHGVKKGLKDIVAPQGMFEDLGLKYLGPVDGHDEHAVEVALRRARAYGGPVLVHVITQKGRGYDHARNHEDDRFHAVGVINPETGLPLEISGRSWTDEFSDEMVAIGARRTDVVGITAAMLIPVGLADFAEAHPDRIFDVGIAEQHATTMAAGLAFGGLHPVVAVYATFLNRAFDQLLMDCALHKAGVTFVLDRSGITGPDGASHHGMWDLTLTGMVPGLHLAAPRDGEQVRAALRDAVDISDGPSVIRFPKGSAPEPIPALRRLGTVDVLQEPEVDAEGEVDLLLVAVGSMAPTGLTVAEKLAAQGSRVRVVDPRWALPVSRDLVEAARAARAVAVVEDGLEIGGVGTHVAAALTEAGVPAPVHQFGIPTEFLDHASRGQVLDQVGLTPDAVAAELGARLT
ncbi:MAG TPA: 1-deoxy-D-xylulose-5-phosphate synthase N-terminal domain-containing protein, partial [Pedococcus sp.]